MGCDIHMMAEKRSKWEDEKQEWEPVLAPLFKNKWYKSDNKPCDYNCPYKFQPYDSRNYALFSVLADVRNGYDIDPISSPRGLPLDVHEVTEWLLKEWDSYDHSPSWLTIEEVMAYDWSQDVYPYGKLADSCSEFLQDMEILKEYAAEENCDIRLVFGFDS